VRLSGIQICDAITVDGAWELRLDGHGCWEIRHLPSIADGSRPGPVITYMKFRQARGAVASGEAAAALAREKTPKAAQINLAAPITDVRLPRCEAPDSDRRSRPGARPPRREKDRAREEGTNQA
jgi:hypothetical protein